MVFQYYLTVLNFAMSFQLYAVMALTLVKEFLIFPNWLCVSVLYIHPRESH